MGAQPFPQRPTVQNLEQRYEHRHQKESQLRQQEMRYYPITMAIDYTTVLFTSTSFFGDPAVKYCSLTDLLTAVAHIPITSGVVRQRGPKRHCGIIEQVAICIERCCLFRLRQAEV